jgi:hypothetical protein
MLGLGKVSIVTNTLSYRSKVEITSLVPISEETVVPCNDIELIWQCHRAHPAAYATDFLFLTGSSPPSSDASKVAKNGTSLSRTKQLWKEMFSQVNLLFFKRF